MNTEEYLRQAFRQSIFALSVTDTGGRILAVNDAFLRLYGFSSEAEVLGEPSSLLHSPQTPPGVIADMWAVLGKGRPWSGDIVNRGKAGRDLGVHLTIWPILESGTKAAYASLALDAGQASQLTGQFFHANRLAVIGALSSGIAHELNNPLTAIVLETDIIQESLAALPAAQGGEIATSVASIGRAADRMKRIIDHFLEYLRPADGGEPVQLSPAQVVEESLLFLGQQLRNRGIAITLDLDAEARILGRRADLELLFHNLLTSSRGSFEGGEMPDKQVRLGITRGKGGMVRIDYSDNAGRPAPELAAGWGEFRPGENGEGALAAGLPVVKKIVLAHGGSITRCVENGWTCLHIELPEAKD